MDRRGLQRPRCSLAALCPRSFSGLADLKDRPREGGHLAPRLPYRHVDAAACPPPPVSRSPRASLPRLAPTTARSAHNWASDSSAPPLYARPQAQRPATLSRGSRARPWVRRMQNTWKRANGTTYRQARHKKRQMQMPRGPSKEGSSKRGRSWRILLTALRHPPPPPCMQTLGALWWVCPGRSGNQGLARDRPEVVPKLGRGRTLNPWIVMRSGASGSDCCGDSDGGSPERV